MSLVSAAAPSAATTPRFLLPRYGSIWRRPRIAPGAGGGRRRYASGAKQGKPIVLEKPAKFNPPSHGSRLPKRSTPQRHYGGDLDAVEQAAQDVKHYPGVMAPKGTWSHWIWHSRLLHTIITMVSAPIPPRQEKHSKKKKTPPCQKTNMTKNYAGNACRPGYLHLRGEL